MFQSDICQDCGTQKEVRVIFNDGSYTSLYPGGTAPAIPGEVLQIEVVCDICGRLYPLHSLSSPIELFQ